MNSKTRSEELFERGKAKIPGGVNSPVRAFGSVGTNPIYIARGKGSHIIDVDGNDYIDYVGSWGPLILGHGDDRVVEAIRKTTERGTSFGANTELEVEFAELISSIVPSIDLVRMVNSGTEATMSAVRLARGYTGRSKVIKFDGCYHGHGDSFLIRAGSGVLTLGIPGSPGITEGTAADTLIASFNDATSVREIMGSTPDEIAAIIVEPVMGNAGVIPPDPGFLSELRRLATEAGVVLIFDEVITGFRVALGGAQELYGVEPDLTCLGKIIGGGLPVGAFGGNREIMDFLAPVGPVYQAGTLSGNPLAMAAGMETVRILRDDAVHERIEIRALRLEDGITSCIDRLGLPYTINRVGSMLSLFFCGGPVGSFEETSKIDTAVFDRYFAGMLARGVYLAPSAFEASFVSFAHSEDDIDRTISAVAEVLADMTGG